MASNKTFACTKTKALSSSTILIHYNDTKEKIQPHQFVQAAYDAASTVRMSASSPQQGHAASLNTMTLTLSSFPAPAVPFLQAEVQNLQIATGFILEHVNNPLLCACFCSSPAG